MGGVGEGSQVRGVAWRQEQRRPGPRAVLTPALHIQYTWKRWEAGPMLKWVAARTRPFAGHEAAKAIYPSSTERNIGILETLEAACVLLRTIPEHSGGDHGWKRSRR